MSSNKAVKNSPSHSTIPSFSKSNTTTSPKKFKRVNSFFKKASIEWNLFCLRLKSLGDEVFNEDQVITELFIETDNESILDKLDKHSKGYSANEENFLMEYKKFKDLNKMYENYQQKINNNEEIKSSSTIFSDNQLRYSLKDVLQNSNSNSNSATPLMNDTYDENEILDNEVEDDEDQSCELDGKEDKHNIHGDLADNNLFNQMDLIRLRKHLENEQNPSIKGQNTGELLWEIRRNQWLKGNIDNARVTNARLFFDQIPKESYVKIYNNLIDKNKSLKSDRRINLYDLMKIINAGWVAEEKWERAARGLA